MAAASGQLVNVDKTTITFSPNVPIGERNEILETLEIRMNENVEKYPGIPAWMGR